MNRCIPILTLCFCAAGLHSADTPPAKPAPSGPLIEVTPLSGDSFSGYLLAMKDGSMDVQLPSGETKTAKTAETKSVRFVPPPAEPTPTPEPAPAAKDPPPADAPKDPTTDPKKQGERREEMKQLRMLIMKLRDGTLTPAEEEEMNKLGERLPLFRGLGGTAGTLALMKLFESARNDVKHEAGHLDDYINKQRDALKDAGSEAAIRTAIMRLACAYHQKEMTPTEVEDQVMKKDLQVLSGKLNRKLESDRAKRLIELMYMINGEKVPKFEKEK